MENGCQQDWMKCTLCRAGREGRDVLRKAQQRKVQWRQPNSGLTNPIEEPVIDTSLDDAFASMMQFMTISSRKCKRYHNSHKQCVSGSAEEKHCLKYHSPHLQSAVISNPLSRPAAVHVDAAPGTYSVTAARWGGHKETTHVVRIEPGQAVSLTLSLP